ncbi:MAG: hypothetical protein KJ626_05555, partial [Verrucomicrobia bacterium]|nr:hypothetical protein [Verrucomicrobiota bacterium]
RYFNTGWSMTGNDPLIGFAQTCVMTITNSAALTWKWSTNYLLSVTASPGGSVNESNSWRLPGAQVELVAAPSNEFLFAGWSGDTAAISAGSVNDATVTVTMTSPATLSAEFVKSNHTLTVVTSFGTATPPEGAHVYPHGAVLTNCVAGGISDGGTQIVCSGWMMAGNLPGSGSTTSLVMAITNDAILTWKWATNFWLTITQNAEGVLSPTSGWHTAAAEVPLSATPPTNMFFWEWTGDVGLITSGYSWDENVTVTVSRAASLTAIYYVLDVSSNLLRNPSFEVQGSSVSNAYYWETGHPDVFGNTWGSAARVNWRSVDGSWEATVRGTWAGTGNQGGWWQTIPGFEGYHYIARGYFYESENWSSGAQGLLLEFLSTNGAVLFATNNALTGLDNSWTYESVGGTAPFGTDRVRYTVYAYNAGSDGALQFDSCGLISYIWHEPYVTISTTGSQHGAVTPIGSWKLPWGSDTNVNVMADTYYHIADVSVDGAAVGAFGPESNEYTHVFTAVRSNRVLTAEFTENVAFNDVPEWWLAGHGFTNEGWDAEAIKDHDFDGLETWREFWAGTHPLDSDSVFESTSVEAITNGLVIRWSSISNRFYNLWVWTNLYAGRSLEATHLPATPAINSYTDTITAVGTRFYRVEVER